MGVKKEKPCVTKNDLSIVGKNDYQLYLMVINYIRKKNHFLLFARITKDDNQDKVIDMNNNNDREYPQIQIKVDLKQTLIALFNKKWTYSKNHWIILLTIVSFEVISRSLLPKL